MAKWSAGFTESDFPEPHRYLLWRDKRTYAIYPSLSLVKAAVSNACFGKRLADGRAVSITRHHYQVFEWDGTGWQEIYEIENVAVKDDHPLWKNGAAPKHKMTVSDEDVAAAIASITGNTD